VKNNNLHVNNKWPKLIIVDTIGIAIGDNEKITNIINETIKRNGIITEKWVIRALIGKPILNIAEIVCERWLKEPQQKVIEKIATEIIEQFRVSFTEKGNSQISKDLIDFLHAARNENCRISGVSWLPSYVTNEIFQRSELTHYLHGWISYNEVPRFHPFPDIIQKISQKEDIYDPNQIAHIGNSKISLLSAYHAQCNWNILLATNEETDWSAYPHTHFIDKTSNLKSIFQSTPKKSKPKLTYLFKKGKPS
jgi:beta-phosphoglucomutase-like phosphatase (HAD superfamily)